MNKITVDILTRLNACTKSIEVFKKLWPRGATWKTQKGLHRLLNRAARANLDVWWIVKKLKLTARVTTYWANGNKYSYSNHVKGVICGPYITWGECNKRITCIGQYENGKQQGKWFYYTYEGRRVSYIDTYRGGKLITRTNYKGEDLFKGF